MPARHREFSAGEMLPGTKYTVVRMLGAGGMGVVYHVTKPPGIQGVLKLMSADLAAHEEFKARFVDEVKVLAELEHPNIVRVNDYDFLADGTPYYVMELLHGKTLRDVLAIVDKPIRPNVAYEITRQLLEALHCAHTHRVQVVHRDIKPENIFLHAPRHGEPVVKLIDFGVAALSDRQHDGQFVGTWRYAAPEQIRGERPTPATDLYAVGLVLYEMLARRGPFDALETGALLSQAHLKQVPEPVSALAPWVPREIVELVASALAKDPRQRPRDAYAFAERLYQLQWADDGAAPSERTAEGPLARVLSHDAALGQNEPPSVPVLRVPAGAQRHGATLQGVGRPEATAPDDDELLAGLLEPREHTPFAKKVVTADARAAASPAPPQVVIRPSGPDHVQIEQTPRSVPVAAPVRPPTAQTLDAPPSVKRAPDTDTFASNASDARVVPKSSLKPMLAVGLSLLALVTLGAGVLAWKLHANTNANASPSSSPNPSSSPSTSSSPSPSPSPSPSSSPNPSPNPSTSPSPPPVATADPTATTAPAKKPLAAPHPTTKKTARPDATPPAPAPAAKPAPSSNAGYMTTF